MRGPCLAVLLLAVSHSTSAAPAIPELQNALTGSWVGVLEYRDYSEPSTSTKRVKLPTWLSVEAAGDDLRFRYVYDDGPAKTVTSNSVVRIDLAAARYTVLDAKGKLDESYAIEGLAQLRQGRGALSLTGKGTENDAAVEVRMTVRVGRNILEILRETAAPGQPFSFRHAYTFVRAAPPAG